MQCTVTHEYAHVTHTSIKVLYISIIPESFLMAFQSQASPYLSHLTLQANSGHFFFIMNFLTMG